MNAAVDLAGFTLQLALTSFLGRQLRVGLHLGRVALGHLLRYLRAFRLRGLLRLFGGFKLLGGCLARLGGSGLGLIGFLLRRVQLEFARGQFVQFECAGTEQSVGQLGPLIHVADAGIAEENRQLRQPAVLLGDHRDLLGGAGIHGVVGRLGGGHVGLRLLGLGLRCRKLRCALGIQFLGGRELGFRFGQCGLSGGQFRLRCFEGVHRIGEFLGRPLHH